MNARGLRHLTATTSAIALLGLVGSASATLPPLHRVYPPGRAYSLVLPSDWRFRNASYASDHATNLWWTTADPLARAVIVQSGCVGCVSVKDYTTPNPAGAVPDAVSTHRVGPDEIAFTGPRDPAEAGYTDDGIVIVTTIRGRINGFIRVDLWLAPSKHTLATAILNSFRVPG